MQALARLPGGGEDDVPGAIGVIGDEVGLEAKLRDVLDARPAQPVVEVRAMEIDPERRRCAFEVHPARVDDDRAPAGQQPGVAGRRVEAEHHARLADRVDQVLEHPRDAVVPHRDREQVLVGGLDAREDLLDLRPRVGGLAARLLAGEDVHLRRDAAPAVDGQLLVPQVKTVDAQVLGARAVRGEELLGDPLRLGQLAARGSVDVQQLAHDRFRFSPFGDGDRG